MEATELDCKEACLSLALETGAGFEQVVDLDTLSAKCERDTIDEEN